MKFTCIVIALTILGALSIKTSNQGKMGLTSAMKKLQTTRWGQVAASFLELQAQVGSPMQDLVQAFQDFSRDIGFKIEIETYDFNVKEAEHNEWEAAIRDRIASAHADINQATHSLEQVLYPRKAELEAQIARDEQLIVDTMAAMEAATAQREANRAAHAAYVAESQEGILALDDCLDLLAGLDSGAASLIQMTKVKKSFQKVTKSLAKSKFSSMIKALIKLADFANPEMLARLVGKFKAVQDSLRQGIADTLEMEADQQAAYEQFMADSQQCIDDAQARLDENRVALANTIQEIADTEAFRAQREADLAVAEDDLAAELARWANEVALFEKLMAECEVEKQAISDVLDILVVAFQSMSEDTLATANSF